MPERLDKLTEQFHHLCAVARDERRRTLNQIERSDPALASQLKNLLEAHDRADGFLDAIDASAASRLLDEDDKLAMPAHAGPFRLLRELGRGGLGVVYLAERAGGDFEQKVAIKLVKHGMDSDAILRRFHAERRILARLEHANIARLIDGGLLDDGRPWFAMEYIHGETITHWADRQQLSINQRLQLLEQVCDAVQYAHSRLIIHRDLKPDNILVTADGTIKLLDFGIAKLLAADDSDHTGLTVAGARAMTPEYAAPEQIRGEPVSAATDVYALGVVAYRLLTGQHPYAVTDQGRASLAEAVCTLDPKPPSKSVSSGNASSAENQSIKRPAHWQKHLRGDVDAIILTALARQPDQRYRSVEALAEDLWRHRKRIPIQARRRHAWYRAGRYIARHRIGLAATAMVLIALAGGMSMALWQAEQARQQAEAAVQSRDFVVSLLRETNPVRSGDGVELRAVDLLRHAANHVQTTDRISADLRARLHVVLGEALLDLGDIDQALTLVESGVEQMRDHHGSQSLEIADGLYALARILVHQDQIDAAGKYNFEALTILEALDLPPSLLHVRTLDLQARITGRLGDHDQSLSMRRRALEMRAELVGSDHPRMASAYYNLGTTYHSLQDFEAAEAHYRESMRVLLSIHEPDHPRMANVRMGIAAALIGLGRMDEARESLEQAMQVARTRLGEQSSVIADILAYQGHWLRHSGRFPDAIDRFEQAAQRHEHYGSDYHSAISRTWAGKLLIDLGRPDEALVHLRRAENQFASSTVEDNPHYAFSRLAGLVARHQTGETGLELHLVGQIIAEMMNNGHQKHLIFAEACELYAELMAQNGQFASAWPWRLHAGSVFANIHGLTHPRTLAARHSVTDEGQTLALETSRH